MSRPVVPSARVRAVNGDGTISRELYRYLQTQNDYVVSLSSQVEANTAASSSTQSSTPPSILLRSATTSDIREGNNLYYTDSRATSAAQIAAGGMAANSANVTLTYDATAKTLTPDLTSVTLGTAGSIKKRAFDAKGRLSDESAATADDLGEGSTNLYYTDARAQSVVDSSIGVPNYISSAETYTVPSNRQVLFSAPIDIDGVLEIDGSLIEVA